MTTKLVIQLQKVRQEKVHGDTEKYKILISDHSTYSVTFTSVAMQILYAKGGLEAEKGKSK